MAINIELDPVIYGRLRALRKAESQLTSQFETLQAAPRKNRVGFVRSLAQLQVEAARFERLLDQVEQRVA
jgi:hypothetical protein